MARALRLDSDPSVRASAVAALVRLGDVTADELGDALADPEPSVRRRALLLVPRTDIRPDLTALLADDDDGVVETAAFAAGEVFAPPAPPPAGLIAALSEIATTHNDALCRESAVAALGAIGDPAGLAAVLTGCRDRATVRRRAVLALAAFEGPEVDAMLDTLTGDRDLQVRQAAEDLR